RYGNSTYKLFPVGNELQSIAVVGKVRYHENRAGDKSAILDNNSSSQFHISSVARDSEGRYTVNFASNLFLCGVPPIVTVTPFDDVGNNRFAVISQVSSSGFSIEIRNNSGSLSDASFNFIAIGDASQIFTPDLC